MKKFFIVAMFLIGFCGISYATDQLLMESDVTWTENPTASYTTLAVSSVTYSTSTAINYGVNFVIQNNGTGNVRYKKGSTSTIGTGGIRIVPGENINIDKWMGSVYFQAEPGVSGTQELIIEKTITK